MNTGADCNGLFAIISRWKRTSHAALAIISILTLSSSALADDTWNYAVQVSATVQTSPPKITLTWPQDLDYKPSSYTVYRKLATDTSWGTGKALSGSTLSYSDTNVAVGGAYEYQIVKVTSAYRGYGYIYAGIQAPLTESRGKLILLVDNRFSTDLADRLATLQQDLVGDGWTVLRHDVSPTNSVQYAKSLIQVDYNSDPANVNTVFLFGHIPVPYSGDISPDEHVPNHRGAWPADVYYGDLDGTWTDSSVNDKGADSSRNWNVPGDGKFDQSSIPGTVQLMVGRVDLSNLPGLTTWDGPPTFPDEESLLANYLDKDHAFRQKFFDVPRRGLIADNFGNYGGEAFSASGWRNFAPFFGPANIDYLPNEGTWLPTLNEYGYLWSYGCGSGGYDSVGGLGDDDQYYTCITPDIYSADIQSPFVMLFGSWFGDWDSQDDLMRAVLATPHYGLACLWSGSPHWFCHHMALGQTLGYSTRLTQNNRTNGLYQTQLPTFAGLVHVALMGDPTLRMHTVSPPTQVAATDSVSGVQVTWNSSGDSVLGYYVYRAPSADGPFTRVSNALIISNSFLDTTAPGGSNTYMVRAINLESSASGTYTNASEGAFLTLNVPVLTLPTLTVSATSSNASRIGLLPAVITFTRTGDTSSGLTANFGFSGTANPLSDFQPNPTNTISSISIPAGSASATLAINPLPSPTLVGSKTVLLTLSNSLQYALGTPSNAMVTINGNGITGVSLSVTTTTASLAWPGAAGRTYHVAYENDLNTQWIDFGVDILGASTNISWNDPVTNLPPRRFYRVFETQ